MASEPARVLAVTAAIVAWYTVERLVEDHAPVWLVRMVLAPVDVVDGATFITALSDAQHAAPVELCAALADLARRPVGRDPGRRSSHLNHGTRLTCEAAPPSFGSTGRFRRIYRTRSGLAFFVVMNTLLAWLSEYPARVAISSSVRPLALRESAM